MDWWCYSTIHRICGSLHNRLEILWNGNRTYPSATVAYYCCLYCRYHKEVLENYGISGKIKFACTDDGANMVKSFDFINLQRIPCVCHCINTFITHFIEAIRDQVFVPIFSEQSSLSKSAVFRQFCANDPTIKLTSIPSYTQTRWYSVFELLGHLRIMKRTILDFYKRKRY